MITARQKQFHLLACVSLIGLILLCILWEAWLAPVRAGSFWLMLKALPLFIPLRGVLRKDNYTMQWTSMLIWLYFTEGIVRAYSDINLLSVKLAWMEVILSVTYVTGVLGYLRPIKKEAKKPERVRMNEFIQQCRNAIGASYVLTDKEDTFAYEQEWRQRLRGNALAVLRPASTQEVARLITICKSFGVSVVPQGGNTGLVLGSIPDASGKSVVLSLKRLNNIRAIDTANNTLTAEAGCLLSAIQQAAAKVDRLYPLSLASEGKLHRRRQSLYECWRHCCTALWQRT
jgi:uncharacterized membrane protein